MVERFLQANTDLFAVLSNGQLLCSPLKDIEWQIILPEIADVNAITTTVE